MKLYDEVITRILELTGTTGRKLPTGDPAWQDLGKENLILRQEMAYELGGSTDKTFALGATAVTDRKDLVGQDEILLIGQDLPDIHADTHYARIALVLVNEAAFGQGNALYNAVKKVEYVRYHVNPEGFMTRVSLMNGRESARVSRAGLQKGLNFRKVGNLMLREYHKNPDILAVKLIFITDPAFAFRELKELVRSAQGITKAIDHVLKSGMTDCKSCSLQKVCEEVEGIKQLHFGMTQQ